MPDNIDKSIAHVAKFVIDKSDIAYHYTIDKMKKKAKCARQIGGDIDMQRDIINTCSFLYNRNFNDYMYDYEFDGNNDYNNNNNNDNYDIDNDTQNVHDSLVQDTIKTKYKTISTDSTANIANEIICVDEILQISGDKATAVQLVLQQIQERNYSISNLESNEVSVLNNSWAAASTNVKLQIINELLDASSGTYLVCPTGVVSRIINANVVENPESSPHTILDLRNEMLQSAAVIRATLEKDNAYTLATTEQQLVLFKEQLEKKYIADYTGVIPIEKIQSELDEWLKHV